MPRYAFVVVRPDVLDTLNIVRRERLEIFAISGWRVALCGANGASYFMANVRTELLKAGKQFSVGHRGIIDAESEYLVRTWYQPPGKQVKDPRARKAPSYWTDDTAAVVNVTRGMLDAVLASKYLLNLGFKHHDYHDLAQHMSLGIAEMMNIDWSEMQDHWGQQYLLRQLLIGDDQ